MKTRNQRGDTLVEVLLSMTLLSAILFTSWSIVNRSTQISLTARQRVVMVNQLKEQAEILKALYADPLTKNEVVETKKFGGSTAKAFASSSDINSDPCVSSSLAGVTNGKTPTNAFYFDESATVSASSATKPVTDYTNARTWIQMVSGTGYIDFYIQGCWTTFGGTQNEDNSRFIVRLNT